MSSINWLLIADGHLPPAKDDLGNLFGYSEEVLLFNKKDRKYAVGCYCHGHNGADKYWHSDFPPTHFAILNEPK